MTSLLIISASALPTDPIRSRQAFLNIFMDVKGGSRAWALPVPPQIPFNTLRGLRQTSAEITAHIWPLLPPQTATLKLPLEPRGIHTVLAKTDLGKGPELFLQVDSGSLIREFWGLLRRVWSRKALYTEAIIEEEHFFYCS